MTREDFSKLPHLLKRSDVQACGYSRSTVEKYADCGILEVVQPKGSDQSRFRKLAVANLLGWEDLVDRTAWKRENALFALAAVKQWTGFDKATVTAIASAGGLTLVKPGGLGEAKYRKEEIGRWIGL